MAFFEDWGRKIGDMGQNTMQKTKDVAGIAKINTQLFDEERKLNLIYQEIGKRYVELHGQDSEPELAENTEKAKQAVRRVEEYHVQIRTIKGLTLCQHCGEEIPEDTLFCSSCGKQVKELPNDACGICSTCGAVLRSGMAFCTSCGAPATAGSTDLNRNYSNPVSENQTVSSASNSMENQGFDELSSDSEFDLHAEDPYRSNEMSYADDIPEEDVRKFCPNCGKEVQEGMAFCTGCGTRL